MFETGICRLRRSEPSECRQIHDGFHYAAWGTNYRRRLLLIWEEQSYSQLWVNTYNDRKTHS